MTHKILIELDQEQEMFVRKLVEKNHTSISRIVECMISHSIWRMTGWEKAIQTPAEYTTSEQK